MWSRVVSRDSNQLAVHGGGRSRESELHDLPGALLTTIKAGPLRTNPHLLHNHFTLPPPRHISSREIHCAGLSPTHSSTPVRWPGKASVGACYRSRYLRRLGVGWGLPNFSPELGILVRPHLAAACHLRTYIIGMGSLGVFVVFL
jgi:hypothetical protein